MQSNEEAELFFKTVSKKVLDYPFINKAVLPRKRKRPNYGSLDNYFQVEGYSNSANTYHPTTPEQYFRQQYFENLDLIISIKNHFNQLAFTAFLKIKRLLLNIILNNNYENELAYVLFQGSNCKSFSDILEYLESLHRIKCATIPNLLTIAYLILIQQLFSR